MSDTIHRNLMVNFIPERWATPDLQAFFQAFGNIEECKVVIDKATGVSKGFGFVKYATRAEAENALLQAQGLQVDTKRLKVQKAELGKGPPGPANVYINGFEPSLVGEAELQQLFAPFGEVSKVRLHQPQPGKKGVAFVTFSCFAEASAAVEGVNGKVLGTDVVTVKIAESTNRQAQEHQQQKQMSQMGMSPMMGQMGLMGQFQPMRSGAQGQRYQPYKRPDMMGQVADVPKGQANPGDSCVFVYGVKGMTDAFLWKLVSAYGAISSVRAPAGKNFGFVNMPNYYEAMNAVNSLNGCMLQGAQIPLQVSFKQQQ
eukprot:NODE_844_length_1158_cov_147.944995_g594_i0.p1 GENE.NODE_844_length_1158_cov_147.944995_g594_i0~~NODE_844_length_1158_cov_147.944995_g594_i0.p1  ORF type:complete len:335 (+),score=127.93 NODE_844_length_1158_cov_147.944995_g594_i0:66-1007(+)